MGLQAYGILLNFAKNKTTIMYEYLGLQDVFFIMLYGVAGFFALLAFILFVHMAYSRNEGTLFMEYLAQVNTIVIIAFLL